MKVSMEQIKQAIERKKFNDRIALFNKMWNEDVEIQQLLNQMNGLVVSHEDDKEANRDTQEEKEAQPRDKEGA